MADDRIVTLEQIASRGRVRTRCDLYKSRTNAVPGAGDPHAEILFIGEGPGLNEDKQGLPFVGRSGDLLVKMLKMIGLTRDKVFITNVVKCRPPENRDPTPLEIETCRPYLEGQQGAIDPLVIVTLGRFSMARYFPNGKITQIHGEPKFDDRRAYIPLFHPAAILRNPTLEPAMEADFLRIINVLTRVREMRAQGKLKGETSVGGGADATKEAPAPSSAAQPSVPWDTAPSAGSASEPEPHAEEAASPDDAPTGATDAPADDASHNSAQDDQTPRQLSLF
ncbi:MAG: uracil-DNA glycosylase [Chloroflexi bacterium]|nr:uracil-DNA glycosylase [Chloroflexota bacterium]